MAISFGGINTGLPPNIVQQLMKAASIPVQNLKAQEAKSEAKLHLVQALENKVTHIGKTIGDLATVDGFTNLKLASGDPSIVDGTVDSKTGKAGTWDLEVDQLAQRAGAMTNGFPDSNKTEIGIGYFKFQTPHGDKKVFITKQNDTLQGAARAINEAGLGVRATVVNDRSNPKAPYRLIISGSSRGDDHQVSYPTLYFLDGDQDIYFDKTQPAINGKVKLDGMPIDVTDNIVHNLIPGLTLNLKKVAKGRAIPITVSEDQKVVAGKVKSFVDGLNSVLAFIQAQDNLNQHSDTSRTLGGDSMLQDVEMRLRDLILNPQYGAGPIHLISQIGVVFNRNGTLDFDKKTFMSMLGQNSDNVKTFLAGNGFSTGFIPALKNTVNGLMDPQYGPLTNRAQGLQDKIRQTNQEIDQMEQQLAQRKKQLKEKFAHLEETMARLKSQGAAVQGMAHINFNNGVQLKESGA